MLDQQNLMALAEQGPERVLTGFVNLLDKPSDVEQAQEFRRLYGNLHPGVVPEGYGGYAQRFRLAWTARTPEDIAAVNDLLQLIFERSYGLPVSDDPTDTHARPTLVVNFATGKIEPKPRSLLEVMALTLCAYRKKLAVCERVEECPHPHFIKRHSRQRFCSAECADTVRGRKKKAWQEEHRAELIEKKRRTRKARGRTRRKRAA